MPVRIRDYPFDNRWFATVSQPAWTQPAIHELMLVRTRHENAYPLRRLLASMPPYGLKTIMAELRQVIIQVAAILTGHPGNPSMIKRLLGRDENPHNPVARFKRALRLGQLKRRLWKE
jgi:hypothetical protein